MCLDFLLQVMEATIWLQIKMFQEYCKQNNIAMGPIGDLSNSEWNKCEDMKMLGKIT